MNEPSHYDQPPILHTPLCSAIGSDFSIFPPSFDSLPRPLAPHLIFPADEIDDRRWMGVLIDVH